MLSARLSAGDSNVESKGESMIGRLIRIAQ